MEVWWGGFLSIFTSIQRLPKIKVIELFLVSLSPSKLEPVSHSANFEGVRIIVSSYQFFEDVYKPKLGKIKIWDR